MYAAYTAEGKVNDDTYAAELIQRIDDAWQQLISSGWERISDEVMNRLEEGYRISEVLYRKQRFR